MHAVERREEKGMARPVTSFEATVQHHAAKEGRIPFAYRIGVTGHRRLSDEPSVAAAVRHALARVRRLVPVSPATPTVPVVVSALAEGADRLVAREILREEGARLEAALPLPPEDYVNDFGSDASRQEFQELLNLSSEVLQAPPSQTREEAYETAGRYVVDRCDALIALWDGESSQGRGGTAEIVGYARERAVPLVWVKTKGEPSVVEELETNRAGVIADAARELDRYNRGRISPSRFQEQVETQREYWGLSAASGEQGGSDPLGREDTARWLAPYLVRVDILALRFQRRFKLLSAAIFILASAAVAVVSTQTKFFPEATWVDAFEVISLLGVLGILGLSRRWHVHDRWISCRFMAERLRSLYFLTLAGTGDRRERSSRLAYFSDPSEAWIERALTEVTARRPTVPLDPPVEPLREYLARYWIEDQSGYHEKAARHHGRWDLRLIRTTVVLFGITLVASFLHMLGIGREGVQESNWGALLIVLAVAVPVIGAAAHGIRTQQEYRRHSERYARMVGLLRRLQEDMKRARSVEEVRRAAVETERIMREENSDWFGVMRFQDMELIT